MLTAANRGIGENIGLIDVCLTPAGPITVPAPYINIALHAMALNFSPNVMITGMNALTTATEIPMTQGMQPGVAHPLYMQKATFVVGNLVVFINGLPGICLGCTTTGNDFNNPLGLVAVPALTNVFFTHATDRPKGRPAPGDPFARDVDRAEISAMLRELASVARPDGPPVEARMLAPGTGYLSIRVFSADVPARVFEAIRSLEAQAMTELVLDLRGNPGGEATAFIELAGDFLEPGSVVVTAIDAEGDETVYRSWQEKPYRFPLTILVDGATASAAELFAGCLEAHGRARLVGGPMFGKHVGQTMNVGAPGPARMETALRYRLPEPRRECDAIAETDPETGRRGERADAAPGVRRGATT